MAWNSSVKKIKLETKKPPSDPGGFLQMWWKSASQFHYAWGA
jgi:hypothetical protein